MFESFYQRNGGKNSFSSRIGGNIGMFSQSLKPLRVKRDETFIVNETLTLDVFWVDNSHMHKDIVFFNITEHGYKCCYGYDHAKPSSLRHSPRIIYICEAENKNSYVVFIVYEDDVVRLRLSINTNYDSSLSLTISSIDSWETVCYSFFHKISLMQYDNPDQNRANPVDVIKYVKEVFNK
jgi:hypothetical protein